ncbi:response regulator [Fibrobacterota bacterium]
METSKEDILRILLVEDNPGDMVLLRETLREMTGAHYELTHAERLGEAEKQLRESAFDVVLLDLNLPDGKGLGNISRISTAAGGVPIIVLTGLNDEMVAVEAVRQGAQDYLVKGNFAPDLFWRAMHYAVERKSIEEKLQQAKTQAEAATKAKSEFLAHISHEIRTPLNIILGAADLLSETSLDKAQKQYVEIFRTSGDTLLFLINDLLDLSKIEAGKIAMEKIDFSLQGLIEEIQKFMNIAAEKKQNRFSCEISPEVPEYIKGDPQRLRQVIFNLLGNAIKFTQNGKVCLKVQTRDGDAPSLLFSIRDTGIGIPKSNLKVIFEAFTQSDSSTSRKFGGTGLGLAICSKLVKLMGGEIWVESKVNSGSTFHFTITFSKAGARKSVPPEKPESQEKDGALDKYQPRLKLEKPLKILLVDDSKDNRLLIRAILKRENIDLDEAEDGKKAFIKFAENAWDLVLMDMQMPEVDGYTCTRTIRDWEQRKDKTPTPVIALTAYSRKEDREKCLKAGCSEYLRKPIKKDDLIDMIEKFSSGESLERKLEQATPERPVSAKIDPLLKDLIPEYLEKKKAECNEILELTKAGDFERVAYIGHGMVGSGASYGFSDISKLGKEIELAAQKNDDNAIRKKAGELSVYLNDVKVVYA